MVQQHRYLVALGSNQPHHRIGDPRGVLRSALDMIAATGCSVEAVSPFMRCRPIGPSQRDFVNAAAIVASLLTPEAMLGKLKEIETFHGREQRGAKWRARVLDLDLILWSGGEWLSRDLAIPHPEFRERDFVLAPAAAIAGDWRDPVTGLTIRQLLARLTRNRPR